MDLPKRRRRLPKRANLPVLTGFRSCNLGLQKVTCLMMTTPAVRAVPGQLRRLHGRGAAGAQAADTGDAARPARARIIVDLVILSRLPQLTADARARYARGEAATRARNPKRIFSSSRRVMAVLLR